MREDSPDRAHELVLTRTTAPEHTRVLSDAARVFVASLAREFTGRVGALRVRRVEQQERFDAGQLPAFRDDTRGVREGVWTVAPVPADLQDRRVEITGPVDRKMIINALNSGARVFMADFEDSNAPTWTNLLDGQANLMDAVRGVITHHDPVKDKHYALRDATATLMVRPRGWHLDERHALVDGVPVPGSLFDFGLFFFHNAQALIERGSGPYFYLPKLQCAEEAALWDAVFEWAQLQLGVPVGTIKATVLIETLPAAFEMHEILHALRRHSAGLNCGRWDYIFSCIKTLRAHPKRITPDRGELGMTQPFMAAYTQLLIQTCHRRGAHAIGGMAAQIPIKGDPAANDAAIAKVHADKLREASDGHDGTWVAHPGLVAVAMEIFDAQMPGPNQLERLREDVVPDADALLSLPIGTPTEAGVRTNLRVGVRYLEAWLRGVGCVPLYHLMEDAATAEISRAQLWQWTRHRAVINGAVLTPARLQTLLEQELQVIRGEVGTSTFESGRFHDAAALFGQLCLAPVLDDFLTLPAYPLLD